MHRNTQSPACSLNQTVIVSNNYTLGNGRVTQKSCALPHCRPLAWLRASCWVPRTPETEATISPACQPSERLQWPCGLQCLVGSSRVSLLATELIRPGCHRHSALRVGRGEAGWGQEANSVLYLMHRRSPRLPLKTRPFSPGGKKMALPHQLRSTQSMKQNDKESYIHCVPTVCLKKD